MARATFTLEKEHLVHLADAYEEYKEHRENKNKAKMTDMVESLTISLIREYKLNVAAKGRIQKVSNVELRVDSLLMNALQAVKDNLHANTMLRQREKGMKRAKAESAVSLYANDHKDLREAEERAMKTAKGIPVDQHDISLWGPAAKAIFDRAPAAVKAMYHERAKTEKSGEMPYERRRE